MIRKPGRTAALVLLTALLSFSVFAGSVIILSLRHGLSSLEGRMGADIIVVPSSAQSKTSFEKILLQGTTGAFYMKHDNLERTLEVDGVEKAAAQVFLASLKADCCSAKIQVIGIDPETDFVVGPWIEESVSQKLGSLDVVAGANVGAEVGEILRIYDQRCHVMGRLASTGTGLDSAVYCSMDTMHQLLDAAETKGITHKVESGDDAVSAIYVKVREGYDIDQVNSAIQGHTRKATAIRTKNMITDVSGSLSGISRTVTWLIGAVWVLSLIILLTAYAMIANERKKEFALLRTLGASRRVLGSLVRREAALDFLAGGMLGCAAAMTAVFPFTTMIEMSLGLPYLAPTPVRILATAAAAVLSAVAAGSLAAAWSARQLSRIDPGTGMRGN